MMLKTHVKVKEVFFLLLFLFVPSLVPAETQVYQEYKDYTIEKGDTLWDISRKELNDPFLWPKVWKENPDINNPDRIYPQQKIKIPLYLLQKEGTPEEPKPPVVKKPKVMEKRPAEKIVAPVKKEYLVNRN